MATIPLRASAVDGMSRVARRGYRIVADVPTIPLLILAILAFVAVFAPILAPHSKLDPVKPTPAQCQAKFGMSACPYIDNAPPFWARGGTLDTPLGTDFLGRDMLSRLMYGARISLVVA